MADRFRGSFALISAGGSALPLLVVTSSTYTDREIADTLILDAAGSGSGVRIMRRDFSDGSPSQVTRLSSAVSYVVHADTIYFACGTMCSGVPGEGWFTANGLLEVGSVGPGGQVNPMYVRLYNPVPQFIALRN